MAVPELDLSPYLIPSKTPISKLDCKEAFKGLSDKEKRYAYHLSKASWEGALICLLQTSPESPTIFMLFQRVFSGQDMKSLRETAINGSGLTESEYNDILVYASTFYSNMGNYKSFGDTKFIPAVTADKMKAFVDCSEASKKDRKAIDSLWEAIGEKMYSLKPFERQIGFPPEGVTTYYSGNCVQTDAEFIKDFMSEKDIAPYNTRLFKTVKNGKTEYEVRLASVETTSNSFGENDNVARILGTHLYKDTVVVVTRGDYSPLMKRINNELMKAKDNTSNDIEMDMLEDYVASFYTGSIDSHKNGSRHWIKNKGPIVETYIGFIESYHDPYVN